MLSQNLLRNLEANQGRMDDLQNQLSSGHRITKPSDDPVGIENALRIKGSISTVNQWQNNASEALSYMNTTDSTLGDLTSMLQRVKELAVQGASDTSSTESRNAIAMEVDQLSQQMAMLANTKVGTKYIFGGTRTNQEPLPSVGGAWLGNTNPVLFSVGNKLDMNITVNGKTLFDQPLTKHSDGVTPTQGLFATMTQLKNALQANNGTAVTATLEDIDGNVDNILAHRADLGARINRTNSTSDQLTSMATNLQKNLSDIQDADMAKTIVDFNNQQNVYQAALSVGAKIIQPSLVDFMK